MRKSWGGGACVLVQNSGVRVWLRRAWHFGATPPSVPSQRSASSGLRTPLPDGLSERTMAAPAAAFPGGASGGVPGGADRFLSLPLHLLPAGEGRGAEGALWVLAPGDNPRQRVLGRVFCAEGAL